MKTIERQRVTLRLNSFRLISLFMKGFLRKDQLEHNRRLGRWLRALDRVRLSHWDKWAGFTRRAFLAESIPPLRAALDRPLGESELLFVAAFVEEFIEKYAMERLRRW